MPLSSAAVAFDTEDTEHMGNYTHHCPKNALLNVLWDIYKWGVKGRRNHGSLYSFAGMNWGHLSP